MAYPSKTVRATIIAAGVTMHAKSGLRVMTWRAVAAEVLPGENLSRSLEFTSPPAGTKSIAIVVMDDSDSPFGFVRWLVYNIPDQARAIPEGASSQKARPVGTAEGLGSAGTSSYARPCPLALNLTAM
jgi:phosphatidylethanolamine-binding protein (PEBP) family uncharacterized protein